MIGAIARKEFVDASRQGRVRLALLLLGALLVLSTLVSAQHAHRLSLARADAQAEDARVWRAQGAVAPHTAAHFGRYAFKAPGPLAFLDEGVEPYVGSAILMEAHIQTPARAQPAQDAAVLSSFGELTPALLLQVLAPLLIILIAFDAFSADRENGTMRLALSLGVRRETLLVGKAVGLTAVAAMLLVPVALVGGAVTVGQGAPDGPARLGLFCGAYAIYFGIWTFVTLAVSAKARSSRQALVGLLGLWIVAAVLAPRLATDAADRLAPVISIAAFKQAVTDDMAKGVTGHDPSDIRLKAIKDRLMAQYGVTRIEDLPINFDGVDLTEGERYGAKVLDKHFGRLWSQYDRQADVQLAFAAVSPLQALRPLSMTLAGTDVRRHRHFTEYAEQYRRTFIQQLNDFQTNNGRYEDWTLRGDQSLWRKAPRFEYRPPALAQALPAQAMAGLILGAWWLLAFILAVWAVRTAPVDARA